MGKQRGNRSLSSGQTEALANFALERARDAADKGSFSEALEWLARAPDGDADALRLEAQLRYRHAAEMIASARYGEAETELRKAGRLGVLPRHLVDERLRLLRNHPSAFRDAVELQGRFGAGCERCRGPDLYRVATCGHQLNPVPPVQKLSASAYAPLIRGVYAACAYRSGWDPDRNDALSLLIRGQKRSITPEVMRLLGMLLADFVAFHTPLARTVDVLVPVPTSRAREESRGGSLPFALARTVRDRLALPLLEPVVQVGEHLDHSQARGEERRRALRSVWEVKSDRRIDGHPVLLVDDIVTTGTTVRAAAELLLEAGAAEIYGVALLHTEGSR